MCVYLFFPPMFPGHIFELLCAQKLIFESSEAVSVVSTFDDLGLKEDLLRGIYAYSAYLTLVIPPKKTFNLYH